MNQNQLLKQMIDFNKTAFDNVFGSMTMIQEQAEKATSTCLDQATWVPEGGKAVVGEWMKACKKVRESFKDTMDDSFQRAESFFAGCPKGE